MKSGIVVFYLIFSSCGGSNDSSGQNLADTHIINNIVFSIKRTVKAEQLAPYSIEDRVIFASRQNRDEPYQQVQAVQVIGDCYGQKYNNSFKIEKIISANNFPLHAILSLEDLQFYPKSNARRDSRKDNYSDRDTSQAYQCDFLFTGITKTGSTKSVQNIKVTIPTRPRGGIAIHHRNSRDKTSLIEKTQLTTSDLKDYYLNVFHSVDNTKLGLNCSGFQASIPFNFQTEAFKSLTLLFNLENYYKILMANPLQVCHITYGKFGDRHWSWSRSFQLFFKDAFASMFDLQFDLGTISHPQRYLRINRNSNTRNSWIRLGVLEINNPFDQSIVMHLNKDHHHNLSSHIFYQVSTKDSSTKEEIKTQKNIAIHFEKLASDLSSEENTDLIKALGGHHYAIEIPAYSSVRRVLVMKTMTEEVPHNYDFYELIGFEIDLSKQASSKEDFLKIYFHSKEGHSLTPVFDTFQDEELISVCVARFCNEALKVMSYNSKMRSSLFH